MEAGLNLAFAASLMPEAKKSAERHRMACAIWDYSQQNVRGHNGRILWPPSVTNATGPLTIHAEEDALARWRRFSPLPPSFALIIRLTKKGNLTFARPCENCFRMLVRAGVEVVAWTLPGGTIERVRIV